ncbi:MAG: hypothetical protein U5K33_08905 [Halofilum sp. (in: g-proteobacteria)]|nr:hypothetical protein [Halofilum sp. (in: g-proteobacteria)]
MQPESSDDLSYLERRAELNDPAALIDLATFLESGGVIDGRYRPPNAAQADVFWARAEKQLDSDQVRSLREQVRARIAGEGTQGSRAAFERIAVPILALSLFLMTFCPLAILLVQSAIWLRTADWPEVHIATSLQAMGVSAGDPATLTGWDGLNQLIGAVLQMPLALALFLAGVIGMLAVDTE